MRVRVILDVPVKDGVAVLLCVCVGVPDLEGVWVLELVIDEEGVCVGESPLLKVVVGVRVLLGVIDCV